MSLFKLSNQMFALGLDALEIGKMSEEPRFACYIGWLKLRGILTDNEYAAARASTENAHYTQPSRLLLLQQLPRQMNKQHLSQQSRQNHLLRRLFVAT